MADYLIQREGLHRAVAYFRGFAESDDRNANFRAAFGQNLAEFEAEIVAHLKSVVP